jgi:hypothetical protein
MRPRPCRLDVDQSAKLFSIYQRKINAGEIFIIIIITTRSRRPNQIELQSKARRFFVLAVSQCFRILVEA